MDKAERFITCDQVREWLKKAEEDMSSMSEDEKEVLRNKLKEDIDRGW